METEKVCEKRKQNNLKKTRVHVRFSFSRLILKKKKKSYNFGIERLKDLISFTNFESWKRFVRRLPCHGRRHGVILTSYFIEY